MPVDSTGGALLASKTAAAVGGLIGGLSVGAFWQPAALRKHGNLAAGAIIGGISVGGAIALGGLVARYLSLNLSDLDVALGLGFLIGVASVFTISAIAKFFDKRDGADILEVAQELRGVQKQVKRPVKRKPSTRKKP